MNEDIVLDKNIKWLFKNSYSDILHLIILMKMSVNQGFLKLLISNTHHPFFNVYATSHNKQTNSVSEITGLVKKTHLYYISFNALLESIHINTFKQTLLHDKEKFSGELNLSE